MRFESIGVPWILHIEGGFVDDPRDNGGATYMGISSAALRLYPDHVKQALHLPKDVRALTEYQVVEIYRRCYWNAVRASELPPGLDLMVFDAAVNMGPEVAILQLQATLGVTQDGVLGPKTLAAAQRETSATLGPRLLTKRAMFLMGLADFDTFGRGWMRRLFSLANFAFYSVYLESVIMDAALGKLPASRVQLGGGDGPA